MRLVLVEKMEFPTLKCNKIGTNLINVKLRKSEPILCVLGHFYIDKKIPPRKKIRINF
jgi:hypothetical protein